VFCNWREAWWTTRSSWEVYSREGAKPSHTQTSLLLLTSPPLPYPHHPAPQRQEESPGTNRLSVITWGRGTAGWSGAAELCTVFVNAPLLHSNQFRASETLYVARDRRQTARQTARQTEEDRTGQDRTERGRNMQSQRLDGTIRSNTAGHTSTRGCPSVNAHFSHTYPTFHSQVWGVLDQKVAGSLILPG
jgi:hypothetical protein